MYDTVVSIGFLVVAFLILYRYVIPRLFPTVVRGVGIINPDGDSSNTVYAFEGGSIPMLNVRKRSHVRANERRRAKLYEEAGV